MNLNRCCLSHMTGAGSGGRRLFQIFPSKCVWGGGEGGGAINRGTVIMRGIRYVDNIVTLVVTTVAKIHGLNKPWSCRYGGKNEKIDMYDIPVHDCTQEQNGSPYFSSIIRP